MLNYWCYGVFSNMIFMQNSKIKANFTCKETCSFVEHFNLNLCQLKFYDQLKIYAQLHIYGMMHCAQTTCTAREAVRQSLQEAFPSLQGAFLSLSGNSGKRKSDFKSK